MKMNRILFSKKHIVCKNRIKLYKILRILSKFSQTKSYKSDIKSCFYELKRLFQ